MKHPVLNFRIDILIPTICPANYNEQSRPSSGWRMPSESVVIFILLCLNEWRTCLSTPQNHGNQKKRFEKLGHFDECWWYGDDDDLFRDKRKHTMSAVHMLRVYIIFNFRPSALHSVPCHPGPRTPVTAPRKSVQRHRSLLTGTEEEQEKQQQAAWQSH